jgi:hypothetical protein
MLHSCVYVSGAHTREARIAGTLLSDLLGGSDGPFDVWRLLGGYLQALRHTA